MLLAAKHGYRSGEDIETLCARIKVSRSVLYRKLNEEGIEARAPIKRRHSGYHRQIKEYPNAHPLVRRLFKEARHQRVSVVRIARAVGVTREAITNWGNHSSPMLVNVIAVGNYLGMDLVWRVKDD